MRRFVNRRQQASLCFKTRVMASLVPRGFDLVSLVEGGIIGNDVVRV